MKKQLLLFGIVVLLVCVGLSGCTQESMEDAKGYDETFPSGGNLSVYYIDVGQGDSILIITPENKTMLIDAGDSWSHSTVTNFLSDKGIHTLDAFIATHPDADHVGGADEVLEQFDILGIYHPGYEKNTSIYREFITAVENEGCPVYTDDDFDIGDFINFSTNVTCQITYVDKNAVDSNDASIVLRIVYKEVSFLFTGDISSSVESIILNQNVDVDVDILKVAHHGSGYSTSNAFLDTVTPSVSVISVGGSNTYGHPAEETLSRLRNHGSLIYRTDQNGTVTITTNGITWDVNAEKEISVNHIPHVSFSYTTSNLTVYFMDSSTDEDGDTLTYSWGFGDGYTSTQKNPTHTYTKSGTYTVTLTISDGKASDSVSKTITVVGIPTNHPPNADFTYTISGLTVYFTDTSTDEDGDYLSHDWDFGDGYTSALVNPTHTYGMSGTYTVALTVDDLIDSDTKSKTVTVETPSGADVQIKYVHYDAEGNDWDNLNDEYVVIKNYVDANADLTGYTLSDDSGYWIPYSFPNGFTLNAGAEVIVYTGIGTDTGTELYWGRGSPIWNNDHDTAYLRDADGVLVDSDSW